MNTFSKISTGVMFLTISLGAYAAAPLPTQSELDSQNQADQALYQYLEDNDGVICPLCQTAMERILGCDVVVCGREMYQSSQPHGCCYVFCSRCLLPVSNHGFNTISSIFNGS